MTITGNKMDTIKPLFCLLCLCVFISQSNAAIVFDGTNSFSSYSGSPKVLNTISASKEVGSITLLQEVSPGQINYNTINLGINRSNITDTEGMVIEAEGFYSFKRGEKCGRISKTGRIGYRVSKTPGGSLTYNITVKKSGIYRFAIDGGVGSAEYDNFPAIIRLCAIDKMHQFTEAQGVWEIKYATGNWNIIQKNYGGNHANDPFFANIFLNTGDIALELIFEAEKRVIQIDKIRVVGFEEEGTAIELHKQQKAAEILNTIKNNSFIPIPAIDEPLKEQNTNDIALFIIIGISIPIFIFSIHLWTQNKK